MEVQDAELGRRLDELAELRRRRRCCMIMGIWQDVARVSAAQPSVARPSAALSDATPSAASRAPG
eukprot:16174764-Heterocapsa_arctica.AAC.1